MPKPFRLAMIQMTVCGGERERNLAHAVALIAEAASNGATVMLLPECLDLGWTHPSARTLADTIPDGVACRQLRDAAQQHGVIVVAGLTERDGDQVYNAAVVIDETGSVVCRHRKLNELSIGHDCYDQGDRLNVAHTSVGTIGLMICADAFATDGAIGQALAMMGADLILSPTAWAVPPDHDPQRTPYGDEWRRVYQPLATAYQLIVVGVSNVGPVSGGPWDGHRCIGCSLAINHDGSELVQGPYGEAAETILYQDLTPQPRPARGNAWAAHLAG